MLAFKNLLKGYRGGPNFNITKQWEYELGDFRLYLESPYSNPILQETPQILNYPLNGEGWFERNCKQMGHRKYIAVHGNVWYFYPLIAIPYQEELGDLILNISIEKTSKNREVNILLPEQLGAYLLKQYSDYYNSPKVGKNALGWNSDIRNKVRKQSSEMCMPYSDEELEETIKTRLNKYGFPDITEYSVVTFNQKQWVFYQYSKTGKLLHYHIALNDDYYLTVKFRLTNNSSGESSFWYRDALKATKRIMENIQIK